MKGRGDTTGTLVALLRGINVGRAKRVVMADLRALLETLGFADVRTLLNSGNVVFTAHGTTPDDAATRIADALPARTGVSARVTVLTAEELAIAVRDNPLLRVARDPSRLLVAVLASPADRHVLYPLAGQDWTPDALALGERVAYLWCPDGALASPLAQTLARSLGDAVTTRNWGTMTKLLALVESTHR
jgi:uncharacterized protein (DUF1697 family)